MARNAQLYDSKFGRVTLKEGYKLFDTAISFNTFCDRVRTLGWDMERAAAEPLQRKNKPKPVKRKRIRKKRLLTLPNGVQVLNNAFGKEITSEG